LTAATASVSSSGVLAGVKKPCSSSTCSNNKVWKRTAVFLPGPPSHAHC
jgi:hypothetical protein